MPDQPQQQQIQIKFDDKVMRGVYSNLMFYHMSKEEFVLDFVNAFPPTGTLNSRVIVSPGHLKRMAAVLADAIKKYEAAHGSIAEAQGPSAEIGFQTK